MIQQLTWPPMTVSSDTGRPATTSTELQHAERKWWDEFADYENQFAWVQPRKICRIIRGRYMREIVRMTPKGGKILELGCGTGWMCIELARLGATQVCGIDFSSSQIAIASTQALSAGVSERVQFKCADGTDAVSEAGAFDCVILHAFLHHLDQTEIRRLIESISKFLKSSGKLVIFEPVKFAAKDCEASIKKESRWLRYQNILADLSRRGYKYGLRRTSEAELRWQRLRESRSVGIPPRGVSPKEMAFEAGELEQYLANKFEITRKAACMAFSHSVMEQWLLRAVSHPRSTRFIIPWVARITAWLDRKLLKEREMPTGKWIFTMFVCEQKRFVREDLENSAQQKVRLH